MNVLTLHDLSFSYETTPILEEVSFSVREKTFVALFGPNGGGKSTLLQLIMGFLKPTRGRIELFGKTAKEGRHLIGWVPQHFRFDAHFPISVREVVLQGCLTARRGRSSPEEEAIVVEQVERVGLRPLLRAPFAALSGGQQQRILIARALAAHPKLLLLDEPTASIDPQAEQAIYALLEGLRTQMTIVMVTHKLTQILPSVDQLFCVERRVTPLAKERVCDHFALGLYHTPESP